MSDLSTALQQARRAVPDDRHIWAALSSGYETTVSRRAGLLLGGAHSPIFLREQLPGRLELPWTVRLTQVRVLFCAPQALDSWHDWLPLLEEAVAARETLLFVASGIDTEFLHMLVVNLLQNTLASCVIDPLPHPSPQIDAAIAALGGLLSEPPAQLSQCPLFAEARIRRSATLLLPVQASPASPYLAPIAEIHVGGRHYDEQLERIRALIDELEPH
ncbi:MAG: hypothetical protein JSR82_17445 [Verrucomicrobia bacterium]|nr:hypothetical protein [Verrucomicrobiota bacterium]